MNLEQKEAFYYELGRLARSGIGFPRAVETLLPQTRSGQRRVLAGLQSRIAAGDSVGEAFSQQAPQVGKMEIAIISACEHSGRLDRGCDYLASYFSSLNQARKALLRQMAYPLFVLHFGILVGNLTAYLEGGIDAYIRAVILTLGVLWTACLAVFAVGLTFSRAGRSNTIVDAFVRSIPLLGKVRSNFSLARFCATYDMNLNAGINVVQSLRSAAEASQSALILQAAERSVPSIRQGGELSTQLARHRVFPQEMIRAIRIGEDTGELEAEILRLATNYQERAVRRLETVAEWLPRLLYVGVMLYVAWRIISLYTAVFKTYGDILEM